MISQLTEDHQNDLKRELHLVAFLDILGFKEYVENYPDNNPNLLNILTETLEKAKKSAFNFYKNVSEGIITINFKYFSDCIYISIPYSEIENGYDLIFKFAALIFMLSLYQNHLMLSHFYIRGGLSLGFHYEDDSIIFSKGLLNAHFIESKRAMYPRIVIDDNVIKEIRPLINDQIIKTVGSRILKDWDGTIFISPFIFHEDSENSSEFSHKFKKETIEDFCNIFEKTGAEREVLSKGLSNPESFEGLMSLCKDMYYYEILENIEKEITRYQKKSIKKPYKIENYEILRKYLWLRELIKWNQDKNSSKIKFEHVF